MTNHSLYDFPTKSQGIINRMKANKIFTFNSAPMPNLPFSKDLSKIVPANFQYGIKADSSEEFKVGKYYETGIPINAGHKEEKCNLPPAIDDPLIIVNDDPLDNTIPNRMYGASFTYVADYQFYMNDSMLTWGYTDDLNPCL